MLWFKHDTDANQDAKLKRLRMRYGMEGYGLYWYCLELIASGVGKHNLTFELEHDAEILAFDTGIHIDQVNEMIQFMVDVGLFSLNSSLTIVCFKLAKRLDQSMTSDTEFRQQIKDLNVGHDLVMIKSDKVMQEKKKKKKKKKNTEASTDFDAFWSAYPKRKNKGQAEKAWEKLKHTPDLQTKILCQIEKAKDSHDWKKDEGKYIPYPSTWLNAKGWEDEDYETPGTGSIAGLSASEMANAI